MCYCKRNAVIKFLFKKKTRASSTYINARMHAHAVDVSELKRAVAIEGLLQVVLWLDCTDNDATVDTHMPLN